MCLPRVISNKTLTENCDNNNEHLVGIKFDKFGEFSNLPTYFNLKHYSCNRSEYVGLPFYHQLLQDISHCGSKTAPYTCNGVSLLRQICLDIKVAGKEHVLLKLLKCF